MSVEQWNAVLNIITNIDYLAIPVAFVVLRNLREPDVPPRVLASRIFFVLLCGAHHGVMAAVLLMNQPLWLLRTSVNAAMAAASCWAVVEHLLWARVRRAPVPAREYDEMRGQAAALARSNAELERFAYVASHDLQEPLRMMSSYAELLQRRYGGRLDDDADDFIEYIVDGARRMQGLIADVLTLSRADSRELQATVVSLDDVLDEVLLNLRGRVQETRARVFRGPLPSVYADRTQVVQLLQNLVENAIKYRGAGPPRVEVGAEETPGGWVFHVRDDGIGVDPRHHQRIFELFQRLHRREEYDGTGLGLALSKAIVERHGGRIWVESEPGAGTTFYFTLPGPSSRAPEDDASALALDAVG